MVQVTSMIFGLAAMIIAEAAPKSLSDNLPAYEIPDFDYQTLSSGNTPNDVLTALKKDGIISFTNVPSYAQVRSTYLNLAATCAVSAKETNAEFLLQKTLTDGTKRYTISAVSGQDTDASATETDKMCPGYKQVYDEFSSLLEMVVLTVATTLDATTFTTKDGYGKSISSRKLLMEAAHVDHFHAYLNPHQSERQLQQSTSVIQSSSDYSLELHTDDGMFIVFATPSFYKVDTNSTNYTLESLSTDSTDHSETGLIIQLHDGQLVRPILKPNQITLMVGTGYNEWVATSEKLPAVPHAMRMPETELTANQRLVRAWFGKMTLLASYQRMLKQMDFAEHRNLTAQYVQQGQQTNIPRLGCAPSRRLVASADSCTYRSCEPKPDVPEPALGCAVVCNRNGHRGDSTECDTACTCKPSDSQASICWMLCVQDLTTCALENQTCSGQTKVCEQPESSPATPPPAPATPPPAPVSPPPATVSPPPAPATPPPPSNPVVPPPASTPVVPPPTPATPPPPSNPVVPPPTPATPPPPSNPVVPPPAPATPPPPSNPVVPPPALVIPAPVPIAPMSPPSTSTSSGQPPSSLPSSSPTIMPPPSVDNQRPSDACKDSDTSVEQSTPVDPPIAPMPTMSPNLTSKHSMC